MERMFTNPAQHSERCCYPLHTIKTSFYDLKMLDSHIIGTPMAPRGNTRNTDRHTHTQQKEHSQFCLTQRDDCQLERTQRTKTQNQAKSNTQLGAKKKTKINKPTLLAFKTVLHAINSHVLTSAKNPCINQTVQVLLIDCFSHYEAVTEMT